MVITKKAYAPKTAQQAEKLKEISFLINTPNEAINLQLENLVITYGYETVRKYLDNLNYKIKKGA